MPPCEWATQTSIGIGGKFVRSPGHAKQDVPDDRTIAVREHELVAGLDDAHEVVAGFGHERELFRCRAP